MRISRPQETHTYCNHPIQRHITPDTRNAMRYLFANKRQRPREHVHKVGQPVRMRRAVELANVHHVVLVLENGGLRK